MRSYRDEQLRDAVAASRSWRGVLRALGLKATSAGAMRSVRAHASRLGLDASHFTGQRRWTEEQLIQAADQSHSWAEVAHRLGLTGGSSARTLKGHAARLGLAVEHLEPRRVPVGPLQDHGPHPDVANLARAGSLLAAAWYELCGIPVSWPLEPCPYDLLVWREGRGERIQVKTGSVRSGSSYTVWISSTSPRRAPYDVDATDQFFIIDGSLNYYVIPSAVVGGLTSINLGAYSAFQVTALPQPTTSPPAGPDRNGP